MKNKLTGLAVAFLMAACSSTGPEKHFDISKMLPPVSEVPTVTSKAEAPEWITKGSGAYHDASGEPAFYGLGSVDKDEIDQGGKVLSEDRARNELAKTFTLYVDRLVEKVLGVSSDNNKTDPDTDRMSSKLEEGIVTILMDSTITDYWEDPDNGKVYSLAVLKLSRLADRVDGFENISSEDRGLLKNTIIQVHAGMNGVEEKVALVEERVDAKPEIKRLLSY